MKLYFLALAFAGFLFTSCQKEALLTEDHLSSSSANRNNEQNDVPFKGNYVTVHTLLQGPSVQRVNGTGEATHLGENSFVANANINFSTAPPFAMSGTATFTAANGDQFYTRFTGSITPPNGVINHVITGGTGRFDDATGAFTAFSSPTSIPLTNNVIMEGTINY